MEKSLILILAVAIVALFILHVVFNILWLPDWVYLGVILVIQELKLRMIAKKLKHRFNMDVYDRRR